MKEGKDMMKAILSIPVTISTGLGAGIPALAIVAVIIAAVLILIFLTGYVKAPPDTAMIISGLIKNP